MSPDQQSEFEIVIHDTESAGLRRFSGLAIKEDLIVGTFPQDPLGDPPRIPRISRISGPDFKNS